jgi:hypothetical protein
MYVGDVKEFRQSAFSIAAHYQPKKGTKNTNGASCRACAIAAGVRRKSKT